MINANETTGTLRNWEPEIDHCTLRAILLISHKWEVNGEITGLFSCHILRVPALYPWMMPTFTLPPEAFMKD